MSVLDELRAAQQRAAERLAELEPLVAEYHALKEEVDGANQPSKADDDGQGTESQTATSRPRRAASASRSRKRPTSGSSGRSPSKPRKQTGGTGGRAATRRSGSGSRREDIMRLVSQSPGLTITDIGRELGVDPTGLYRPVRKLVADGQLLKDGAKLTTSG